MSSRNTEIENLKEAYGIDYITKLEDKLVEQLSNDIDRQIVEEIFEMDRLEKERIAKIKADREDKIDNLLDEEE